MNLNGAPQGKTDEHLTCPFVQWRLEARQNPDVKDIREPKTALLGIIAHLY